MDIEDILKWVGEKYGWIALVSVALISILVEFSKIPIKALTKKIPNERARKLANKSIIFLSFGFAFLIEWLEGKYLPKYTTYNPAMAIIEGAFSNLIYALSEGIITKSKAKESVGSLDLDKVQTAEDMVAIVKASSNVYNNTPQKSETEPSETATEKEAKSDNQSGDFDEIVESAKKKFESIYKK